MKTGEKVMPSDKIIQFNDEIFDRFMIKSKLPVMVNFWAQNCGPCRTLAPILDELAEEYDGLLTIGFVNVEECPKTVKAFRISSVPTLAFIVDGITEQRIIGLKSAEEIKTVIEKYVRRNKIGNTDAEQDA